MMANSKILAMMVSKTMSAESKILDAWLEGHDDGVEDLDAWLEGHDDGIEDHGDGVEDHERELPHIKARLCRAPGRGECAMESPDVEVPSVAAARSLGPQSMK
jgi:hypothetical protein